MCVSVLHTRIHAHTHKSSPHESLVPMEMIESSRTGVANSYHVDIRNRTEFRSSARAVSVLNF